MTYQVNCNNSECPENHRCGRFMAEPKANQVYEKFKFRMVIDRTPHPGGRPRTVKVFGCQHFYSMPDKVLNAELS